MLRWFRRKRAHPDTLPKGTRPRVHIECDGITYDVTDDLERQANEDDMAVWLLHGPSHVIMRETPNVLVLAPIPAHTHIKLALTRHKDGTITFTPRDHTIEGLPSVSHTI